MIALTQGLDGCYQSHDFRHPRACPEDLPLYAAELRFGFLISPSADTRDESEYDGVVGNTPLDLSSKSSNLE